LGTLALLLAAPPARADWFLSPMIGANFSGDTNPDSRKTPFAVSFGYMGNGVFGYETTLSYTPSFFGNSSLIGDNNVFSVMANLILGVPIGEERQFRPYISGGAGLLRSRIGGGADDLFDITNNDWGLNVGAGAMGYFSPHVGLRADVRYFRSLSDSSNFNPVEGIDVDLGRFNFWQATGGLTFRF
jgi:opacity protein-like surface antigen